MSLSDARLSYCNSLIFSFCSSQPYYVIGFLQTLPRDRRPCLDSHFRSIRRAADFHRLELRHAWRTSWIPAFAGMTKSKAFAGMTRSKAFAGMTKSKAFAGMTKLAIPTLYVIPTKVGIRRMAVSLIACFVASDPSSNRVGGVSRPRPLTPPYVRCRIRRFKLDC